MRRALFALAVLVAAGIAAALASRRDGPHAEASPRDRLDVHFGDGSSATYVDGSTEATQLLPLARQALAAVQA